MDKRQKRINNLKAELKLLEADQNKGKKKGVFKVLGESTKHVFKSLGAAGKKVLSNPTTSTTSDSMDLDKLLRSLPA